MPGKANKGLATEKADNLVFSWVRNHPGTFWLWGFIVLSLLLHATGFYLFQVVYPSSGRLEPFPARVLILDEKNAANTVLLQDLNDHLVFLQPASAGSESRKSIEDFPVSFRPSFADREPPFRKPLVEKQKSKSFTIPMLPTTATIFPPFQAKDSFQPLPPKAKLQNEKPAIRRRWTLEGDLNNRTLSVTRAKLLDKALLPLGEGPAIVLSIVVEASGEISQISVKSGKGHPATGKIAEAVKKDLKFDPVPGNAQASGVLTIRQ